MICTLMLSGCNRNEAARKEAKDEAIKIGLSFDSFVIERWHREQEAFISKTEELGAEVFVQNANGSVEKQINQMEHFIEEGMDVIVLNATDVDAVAPVVTKARSKGIKIIAYDRLVKNAGVDLYISSDNQMIGKLLTEELLTNIEGKKNILVIMGSPSDSNVAIIDEEFERLILNSDVHVLEKVYAPNWLSETAFNVVSAHLQQGEEINGIFCGNDDLAQQAIMALSEYRQAGQVCVVGQDADLSACQRIVEGTQNMTVYKNVIEMAREAATMAVKLAKGEALEIKETVNDGTVEVPYYRMMPIKVTKENIDQVIIDSGFHLKDEVYLNMIESDQEEYVETE